MPMHRQCQAERRQQEGHQQQQQILVLLSSSSPPQLLLFLFHSHLPRSSPCRPRVRVTSWPSFSSSTIQQKQRSLRCPQVLCFVPNILCHRTDVSCQTKLPPTPLPVSSPGHVQCQVSSLAHRVSHVVLQPWPLNAVVLTRGIRQA